MSVRDFLHNIGNLLLCISQILIWKDGKSPQNQAFFILIYREIFTLNQLISYLHKSEAFYCAFCRFYSERTENAPKIEPKNSPLMKDDKIGGNLM